jgi:hypothetical protein
VQRQQSRILSGGQWSWRVTATTAALLPVATVLAIPQRFSTSAWHIAVGSVTILALLIIACEERRHTMALLARLDALHLELERANALRRRSNAHRAALRRLAARMDVADGEVLYNFDDELEDRSAGPASTESNSAATDRRGLRLVRPDQSGALRGKCP